MKFQSDAPSRRDLPSAIVSQSSRGIAWAALFLMQVVIQCSVQAQPSTVVEELLHLDTQAALLAARQKIVGPLQVPGPVVTQSSENILLAIYGVGSALTAEVLLDAEPHVFKSKRTQAVSGRAVAYTLERIEPPCIYLKKEALTERLCLGQMRP